MNSPDLSDAVDVEFESELPRGPLPVIALVGRPNVGKSTLFNGLTGKRDALVADFPGLTRDCHYGRATWGSQPFIVVDTGGVSDGVVGLEAQVADRSRQAIQEADAIILVIDGVAGITSDDQYLANFIRKVGKPAVIAVNKTDRADGVLAVAESYSLALGEPVGIAAAHRRGFDDLLAALFEALTAHTASDHGPLLPEDDAMTLAIIGRPNVGKSTLINRLLGEARQLTADLPGTTRDSVRLPFTFRDRALALIDTAGVRRRSRVDDVIEKFSIIKTLQAISQANVVVMLLDGQTGVVEQDAHLLGLIVEAGKALVIAVNKWDHLSVEQRQHIRDEIQRRLVFVDYAPLHFISALHGSNVMEVMKSALLAYEQAAQEWPTSRLCKVLEQAVATHSPPVVRHGQRVKLRYAHQGGKLPPRIVIHGSRTPLLPKVYRRYLTNFFRDALKLQATPLFLEFRDGQNPYDPAKNPRS